MPISLFQRRNYRDVCVLRVEIFFCRHTVTSDAQQIEYLYKIKLTNPMKVNILMLVINNFREFLQTTPIPSKDEVIKILRLIDCKIPPK